MICTYTYIHISIYSIVLSMLALIIDNIVEQTLFFHLTLYTSFETFWNIEQKKLT